MQKKGGGIISRIYYFFSLTRCQQYFILGYELFILGLEIMGKTVKFAVSMSEDVFKELESLRRKTGWTRSQFIRDAIRSWKAEVSQPSRVREEVEEYKKEAPTDIVDPDEQRRRAIEAAGRFRSGISDLSVNHDKYLEESYTVTEPQKDDKKTR